MNGSRYRRLVWKEYRLQRSLWIAMAALIVMVQGLVAALVYRPQDVQQALFWIAFGLPVFYALGSGAMAFCGEHEAETYEFQRALPVSAKQVFWGKVSLSLASIVAMFALMALLAFGLNHWRDSPLEPRWLLWGSLCLLGLEMFLWATLFSLLLRHVLVAAVLAVVMASWIYNSLVPLLLLDPEGRIVSTMPLRLAIAATVAIANYWLGIHWFEERAERRRYEGSPSATGAASAARRLSRPSWTTIVGRLLWQHWRQSRLIMLVLSVWFVPLVLIGLVALYCEFDLRWRYLTSDLYYGGASFTVTLALAVLLALIGIPQFGLCAFMGDQRRQGYRFLAVHGVPPRYLWWSRLLVSLVLPAALLLVCLLIIWLCPAFANASEFLVRLRDVQHWAGYWDWVRVQEVSSQLLGFVALLIGIFAYVLLGLSIGQFCSMFFRSSLLAGFASVILTAIATAWCAAMLYLGVPVVWSVLPIPVILLLATRLRTAGWMTQRNDLRAWLPPGLILVAPSLSLLIGVSVYRIYQVPAVDPGFSLADYTRPMTDQERATLALYREAASCFQELGFEQPPAGKKFSPQEWDEVRHREMRAWVKANQKAIAWAMKASRRKLYVPMNQKIPIGLIPGLPRLLSGTAAVLQGEGKLDQAMEQYLAAIRIGDQLVDCGLSTELPHDGGACDRLLSWALHPKQTSERILAAVRQLGELPTVSDRGSVVRRYFEVRTALSSPGAFLQSLDHYHWKSLPNLTLLWPHLPWERARALRLLNVLTRSELDLLAVCENNEREGKRVWNAAWCELPQPPQWGWSPYGLHTDIYSPPFDANVGAYAGIQKVRWSTRAECARRAARLRMALEAWRLQHGSLPKTLDELVGPCLDRLPVDPYAGVPFRYRRTGISVPMALTGGMRGLAYQIIPVKLPSNGKISANTPFVWSTGEFVDFNGLRPAAEQNTRYTVYDIRDHQFHTPQSEYDIWTRGWPFPIPQPTAEKQPQTGRKAEGGGGKAEKSKH